MASSPGDVPSHIREIQRNPLALTSWWRLERTASPVDAPSLDLGTATPFQSFVDAEDQRTIAPVKLLE